MAYRSSIYNGDMIALFDSGLGGLSVLQAVQHRLPGHDLLYFADTAFCPYGPRSRTWIQQRSLAIGRWLIAQGADMLVVACNTATSAALELLRAQLPIPIVGMEPGVKPAVAATRSQVIGVLATEGTLRGPRFSDLVARFANHVEVITQPCPGWVALVEQGDFVSQTAHNIVIAAIQPLLERRADVLVLGCTHYPFLLPLLAQHTPSDLTIIDTGPAVARQVALLAEQRNLRVGRGDCTFYTTGDPQVVTPIAARLLRQGAASAALEETSGVFQAVDQPLAFPKPTMLSVLE
jgi:glutamate racemase